MRLQKYISATPSVDGRSSFGGTQILQGHRGRGKFRIRHFTALRTDGIHAAIQSSNRNELLWCFRDAPSTLNGRFSVQVRLELALSSIAVWLPSRQCRERTVGVFCWSQRVGSLVAANSTRSFVRPSRQGQAGVRLVVDEAIAKLLTMASTGRVRKRYIYNTRPWHNGHVTTTAGSGESSSPPLLESRNLSFATVSQYAWI